MPPNGDSLLPTAIRLCAAVSWLAIASAQAPGAPDPLQPEVEMLQLLRRTSPHRLTDEELAAANAALERRGPGDRAAPEFLQALCDLCTCVTALGRGDASLRWLLPVDAELAAASDPVQRHRLALCVSRALVAQSRHADAAARLEPAVAQLAGVLPAAATALQDVRRDLAGLRFRARDYRAALQLQVQVIAVDRDSAVADEVLIADLRLLGNTYHFLGQRQQAYDAFEERLALARRTWPKDDDRCLTALGDFAAANGQIGDYRAAYELLREELAARERTASDDPLPLLHVKQSLSQVLTQLHDLDAARQLQGEVLEALEASPSPDQITYFAGLQYFARIQHAQGDVDGARATITRFLQGANRGNVPEFDRDIGSARTLLGVLERRRGNLDEARAQLEASYAGLASAIGYEPNFTQIACAELIRVCRMQGARARAAELCMQLLDCAIASVRQSALAARGTARLVALQHMGVQHALSLAFDLTDPAAQRPLVAKALLVSQLLKNAAGRVARATNRRREQHASELARLEAELAAATQARSEERIAALVRDKERIERMAARPDGPDEQEAPLPTLHAIAAGLPEHAVAAATVPFVRWRVGPEFLEGSFGEKWLAGIVLARSGDVHLVDLGSLDAMTQLVDGMCAATHKRLRSQVLDPLLAAAPAASMLCVALDDCLHLVPWDSLPTADGPPVAATLELRRISSLLDLTAEPTTVPVVGAKDVKLVAVGGVDYGAVGADANAPATVAEGAAPSLALLLRSGEAGFPALAGSLQEVQDLAAQFGRAFPAGVCTVLGGGAATKSAVADAVSGAAFVHFATHGFVAYERIAATAAAVGGGTLKSASAELAPFSLAGMALAGANLGPDQSGLSPGLVTAGELQHFELGVCYLAVLSACESAMGAWSKGQGFASLQESLHIAGARYVVSTLWPVNDAAARQFMAAFYAALWQQPGEPYRALWHAKQHAMQLGLSFADWAAFQLSGT